MEYDLVFEGGGAKGMVFVGALEVFEKLGHKHGRLLGTSAGAITATLLAAGYSPSEMLTSLNEKLPNGRSVFSSFMATPGPFEPAAVRSSSFRAFLRAVNMPLVPDFLEDKLDDAIANGFATAQSFRNIFSFIEQGGWYSADNFLSWMTKKLNSGSFGNAPRNFGSMTLQQFFEATGTELSLVASDTTARQILVLNHLTAPDCPVAWAARMSMSIPLLWQEVIWQAAWGNYNHRSITGNTIVDGGMLSNFPIELFLSDLHNVTNVMGPKVSQEVLGFLIDDDAVVPDAPPSTQAPSNLALDELVPLQRISRLVDTALSARDKMVIESYANLVVHLPAKDYGTTEFDMTEARQAALVEAGRQSMTAYFKTIEHKTGSDVSFGIEDAIVDDKDIINRVALKIIQ